MTTILEIIKAAVEPFRAVAMDAAEREARATVVQVGERLEAAGFDRRALCPSPNSNGKRSDYFRAVGWRNLVQSITVGDKPMHHLRGNEPDICKICPEAVEIFVKNAKRDASHEFDLYVAKLTGKVSEKAKKDGVTVLEASQSQGAVWFKSHLLVTMTDGTTQRWNTQTIVNYSVHGKAFNQFPTRLEK
jgi:hypothetical protein